MPKHQTPIHQSDGAGMRSIFMGVFGSIAVVTGLVAVASGIGAYRTISQEHSAPGKVVQMTKRTSTYKTDRNSSRDRQQEYTQDYYYPVVEFELPNGRKKTTQLGEGSWPPAHEVGEAVTIRYHPAKPIDARIDSASSTMMFWILPIIMGGLSFSFAIGVIGVHYIFKAEV